MTRERALGLIGEEFAAAGRAAGAGNEGMVRVCARRAAGIAIGVWLAEHPRPGWPPDAVGRLRCVESDGGFPEPVRLAARRLSARVKEDFTPRYASDPLEDSRTIIDHLLRDQTNP
jgi:hypothetical protein